MEYAGILSSKDVDTYVKTLESNGFETPLLFLGLKGNIDYTIQPMKFKTGHAIRVQAFLAKFDTNM